MGALSEGQVMILLAGGIAAALPAGIAIAGLIELSACAVAWAWRRRRIPGEWLPAGAWLAWWRWRKAPVPRDGALDLIDEGRWALALRGYGDKAGTEAVTDAELEAEALMSDVEDS